MATMGVIEGCRILSGWKGNLTESKGSIGVSLVLIVPAVLSCVYLLVFQSYVLRWVLHCCTAPALLHLREVSQQGVRVANLVRELIIGIETVRDRMKPKYAIDRTSLDKNFHKQLILRYIGIERP